jgi:hypothetical protein
MVVKVAAVMVVVVLVVTALVIIVTVVETFGNNYNKSKPDSGGN